MVRVSTFSFRLQDFSTGSTGLRSFDGLACCLIAEVFLHHCFSFLLHKKIRQIVQVDNGAADFIEGLEFAVWR